MSNRITSILPSGVEFSRSSVVARPTKKPYSRILVISKCHDLWVAVKQNSYAACSFAANSTRFTAFTTLLTLFVLFGDDIRLLSTEKPMDQVFDVLTISSLIVFSLEIFAHSVAKEDYWMSFFMVLDSIATVTLIFDVSTVAQSLSAQSDTGEGGEVDGSMARASRASRAGTRAARVVRIIRLIRLFRIVKLYKASLNRSKGGSTIIMADDDDDEDSGTREPTEESRVGKKMSEKTTKKVIMIVLGMMAATPLFVFGTLHESDPQSKQIGSDLFMSNYVSWRDLKTASSDPANDEYVKLARETFEDSLLFYVYVHNPKALKDKCGDGICAADYTNKVMWIGGTKEIAEDFQMTEIDPSTWNDRFSPQGEENKWIYSLGALPPVARESLSSPFDIQCNFRQSNITGISLLKDDDYPVRCPDDLRFNEQLLIVGGHNSGTEEYIILMYFDLRETSKFSAFLNILTTLFICGILWWGAMAFSKVTDTLVLHPLERMIERVEIIKRNPLEAMYSKYDDDKSKAGGDPVIDFDDGPFWKNNRLYIWYANRKFRLRQKVKVHNPMETVVLEKTIIKICSLMALGFGEAGMEIISQNMAGGTSSSVNAMIPGRKIHGIFAFCDIRSFLDATEVLQDEIMVFVNKISGVIHPTCDEFLGAPNKNVGDSFLIVWRFEPWYDEELVRKVSDLAMMSLVKVVGGVNVNKGLRAYRKHEGLLKRIPNFSVRMGFGVHVGWAIEGAIGSEFKIDASYLSPNVNMASTLEALTKIYGVTILGTNTFVNLLSLSMASVCRIIDHVVVRGYKGSVRLYTVDLNTSTLSERLQPSSRRPSLRHDFAKASNQERRAMKLAKLESSYVVYDEFHADEDITAMRLKYTSQPGFTEKFLMAVLNYESGEWEVARVFLEFTLNFLPGAADGPSVNLLNYLKLHDYSAPKEWPGYRDLETP
eukprot:GEMP01007061.1.p1 GENE.GEMP01007061.1~~GEMP01007061.1.p1  ORF type:complete len:957 (+),score=156.10 GEMP01007061.1:58-2871(+)